MNAILRGGQSYEASLLLQILATKVVVTAVCRGSGQALLPSDKVD